MTPTILVAELLNHYLGGRFQFTANAEVGGGHSIEVRMKKPILDQLKAMWGNSYDMTFNTKHGVSCSMDFSLYSWEGDSWSVMCSCEGEEGYDEEDPPLRKAADPNFHELILQDLLNAVNKQARYNYNWSVEDLFDELENQHSIIIEEII